MQSVLQKVITYWYRCVKAETALERDISIAVRSRAVLYPFDQDKLITGQADEPHRAEGEDERLTRFLEYTRLQALDVYYGYPLLCYTEEKSGKTLVAPVMVRKVVISKHARGLTIRGDEPLPSLGVQALAKLGARAEEIADLNRHLADIFAASLSPEDAMSRVVAQIETQIHVPLAERLNPLALTNKVTLNSKSLGVYNKSILFAGESTTYNMHLLADLDELCRRGDLERTALSFLLETDGMRTTTVGAPILAFPCNEFQISAVQRSLRDDFTVITGPPGTGKSQLIANLLINILLRKESCLFVSHTNEAVGIVATKLNETYRNIITRTGSREFRQELKGAFNELLAQHSKQSRSRASVDELWLLLSDLRNKIQTRDDLEQRFVQEHASYQNIVKRVKVAGWWPRWVLRFQAWKIRRRLRSTKVRLQTFPTKDAIERSIQEDQNRYFDVCHEYVESVYVRSILGDAEAVGAVNAYLHSIASRQYYDELDPKLFSRAARALRVWCCTLKSVRASFPLEPGLFDYVIFDEASQIDLPSAAPALYRAKRAVVVGDPMQLNHIATLTPDVDRRIARESGVDELSNLYPSTVRYRDISLYRAAEHALERRPIFLADHYRSEDEIIALCNRVFYSGHLRIRTPDRNGLPRGVPTGVCWIDCKGHTERHSSGSRFNAKEVDAVGNAVRNLIDSCAGTKLSIGVVTPYSRQQAAILDRVRSLVSDEQLQEHNVEILTAHRFQGSEKDIMVFSVVLASEGAANNDRWYDINPQIINVALSRARLLLYIVGDKAFCLSRSGILGKIASAYDALKSEKQLNEASLHAKFDTESERLLFEALSRLMPMLPGYQLVLKPVIGRYTLDMAIRGDTDLDIECDGTQHEIIDGLPVIEDIERDRYLADRAWRVTRVPNHEILSDSDAAARRVIESLTA